jgi:ABC-type branched-subunit amino acid transport system ATPase component
MTISQTQPESAFLMVENLTKEFGGLRAVSDCTFKIPLNSIFGLIGPNGSGKSTIFNMISGSFPPTSGHVNFKGEDITGLPSYQVAQRRIARTFQMVKVFPKMTLLENILVGAQNQYSESIWPALVHPPKVVRETSELINKAMGLLGIFGLSNAADRFAVDVSYAEQKMTEIARALMADPELILLDEPASGILPSVVESILDYVHQLRDHHGKTFIIIEHNMRVIMNHCDWIIVLNAGREIAEGTPDEIRRNPDVIKAYLGE